MDKRTPASDSPTRYRIAETHFGIWKILTEYPIAPSWFERLPFRTLPSRVQTLYASLPVVRQFLLECYTLAPQHLIFWFFLRVIMSFRLAASLYISSLLLDVVEAVVEQRNPDLQRLAIIGVARILFSLVEWTADEFSDQCERVLRDRIGRHMTAYKVRVYSKLDVPASHDPTIRSQLEHLSAPHVGWNTLSGILRSLTKILTIASQISVLLAVFRNERGGREFFLLALIQPALLFLSQEEEGPMPAGGVYAVYRADANNIRMNDMEKIITNSTYREEIVGAGLRDYFLKSYNAADRALGPVPMVDPFNARPPPAHQHSSDSSPAVPLSFARSPLRTALPYITTDLPRMLFALYTSLSSGRAIPLKALLLLEHAIAGLTQSVREVLNDSKNVELLIRELTMVYGVEKEVEKACLKEGGVKYPREKEILDVAGQASGETTPETEVGGEAEPQGMKIEFKNVSFTYPESNTPALRDLNFTIQPGQLCVIVGENGSGKSSTTKLLQRIYDPTKGEILIDDLAIQDYRADDVRRATSLMWQGYQSFPVTIGENISVGASEPLLDLSSPSNASSVKRAAELGNAASFIEHLPKQYDTEIAGTFPARDTLYDGPPDGILKSIVAELGTGANFSGGEWQRLALARTFMKSDGVRLAAYDEPSASLDPKAEFELFERLRATKGKRTMLFITHRFGHLTKYADVILFMKDGTIVEQGSHQELLAADGEYAALYNVQAMAFAPPSASGTEPDGDDWSVSNSEEGWNLHPHLNVNVPGMEGLEDTDNLLHPHPQHVLLHRSSLVGPTITMHVSPIER